MIRRDLIAPLVAVAAVIAVAVGLRVLIWSDHPQPGEAMIGGPFTLVDGDGRTVSDTDYRGRFMLVYFGYTFCPDVCPTTLSVMAAALDKLSADERKKVAPLFVSVDPQRDTPAVMKAYVASFHAGIEGLTGSEEQVAEVARAYKVYAAKVKSDDPKTYSVDHSSIVYLMGPDGRLVTHYTYEVKADEMAASLHKVLN